MMTTRKGLVEPRPVRRIVSAITAAAILGTGIPQTRFALAPAHAAVTSSTAFVFKATQTFVSSTNNWDMLQGYTPGSTSSSCPSTIGNSWNCIFNADTFGSAQTMAVGSAIVSLYVQTSLATITTSSGQWSSTTNSGTSISLTKPTSVVSGDVMVAIVNTKDTTSTMTAPSGWTLQRYSRNTWYQQNVYTKTYAGEAGPYAFGWTNSNKSSGAILAFSNVDTTTPIHMDAYGVDATPGGFTTTHPTPAIVTSLPNEMLLAVFGETAGATTAGTNSTVTGMTEALDFSGGNGGTFMGMAVDYLLQTAAGTTGTKSTTSSVSGGGLNYLAALKPLTGTLSVALYKNGTTQIGTSTTFTVGPGTGLYNVSIPIGTAVPFTNGDRLSVKVTGPTTFNAQVWFGSTSQKSQLVTPPFGTLDAKLSWSMGTAAASMSAPGVDPWTSVVVSGSNDNNLYSMNENSGGAAFTNGPFPTGGAIQGRPTTLPASFRTPASTVNVTFASSQDGAVYAVDTSTGLQVWRSPSLGTTVQAGPNVWLQKTKSLTICSWITSDVLVVAAKSGDTTTNKVYALNAGTATASQPTGCVTNAYPGPGDVVWKYAPGTMDISSSTPLVDYTNNAVWVTTRGGASNNQPVLWKIAMATGLLIASWTAASLGDTTGAIGAAGIDSAPVLSSDGAWVYVGTNGGGTGTTTAVLAAIPSNATTSNSGAITFVINNTTKAPCNCAGTGAVEGMPWVVTTGMPDTIVFTRDSTVHSVAFNGTTFTANWVATLTGTPTLSAPVDDGAGHIYVGGSDGKVHQVDLATGTDQKQLPTTAISGTMGDPTFDPDLLTVIVGGSDGHIYSFQTPF